MPAHDRNPRGFEELLHKEPLLRLVDSPDQAADALAGLQAVGFDDGLANLRWTESQNGTWQARAAFMEQEFFALWRNHAADRDQDVAWPEQTERNDALL